MARLAILFFLVFSMPVMAAEPEVGIEYDENGSMLARSWLLLPDFAKVFYVTGHVDGYTIGVWPVTSKGGTDPFIECIGKTTIGQIIDDFDVWVAGLEPVDGDTIRVELLMSVLASDYCP